MTKLLSIALVVGVLSMTLAGLLSLFNHEPLDPYDYQEALSELR